MHKLALEQRRLAAQMISIIKKKSTEHQGIMKKRVKTGAARRHGGRPSGDAYGQFAAIMDAFLIRRRTCVRQIEPIESLSRACVCSFIVLHKRRARKRIYFWWEARDLPEPSTQSEEYKGKYKL
jgi:hypothetical protein